MRKSDVEGCEGGKELGKRSRCIRKKKTAVIRRTAATGKSLRERRDFMKSE
jgi:hypothetical protein